MARKSRQSFLKRQREARRAEKAALKRQKRMERRQKGSGEEGDVESGGGPPIEAFEDSPIDGMPIDGPPNDVPPIDESLPAPEPLPEEAPVERES